LDKKVNRAVITVPAHFNDAQRQATKDAGTIAGLDVLRIINEPTAAAIGYNLHMRRFERKLLVYQLGGGTFDVSVLLVTDGVFEVLATDGNTRLGGKDFDDRVMVYLMEIIKSEGHDIKEDNQALAKLRREVEKAKHNLSRRSATDIFIRSLVDGYDFVTKLNRTVFEELNDDLFQGTIDVVKEVVMAAGLTEKDITDIISVGGSTQIPKIKELLKEHFDNTGLKGVNRAATTKGAAMQGGILSGEGNQQTKKLVMLDVAPHSIGLETLGGVMTTMIEKNSVIPTQKSQTFSTIKTTNRPFSSRFFRARAP
jgi:heat shock protein 5